MEINLNHERNSKAVELLIALLDEIGGNPDDEPWLASTASQDSGQHGYSIGDCEPDECDDEESDPLEPNGERWRTFIDPEKL
jgi:hypothetical protein